MRGKVRSAVQRHVYNRITPAYAGKSMCQWLFRRDRGDHPRLCGEKSTICNPLEVGIGSPPPMRGKAVDGISHIYGV